MNNRPDDFKRGLEKMRNVSWTIAALVVLLWSFSEFFPVG